MNIIEQLPPISFADAFTLAHTILGIDAATEVLTRSGLDPTEDVTLLSLRATRAALNRCYVDEVSVELQRHISSMLAESAVDRHRAPAAVPL